MMTPERWQRIKTLFNETLALPRAERDAYLEKATGGEAQLRLDVESLIAAHDESGDPFEQPLQDAVASAFEADGFNEPSGLRAGSRIGAYRLTELIGRGGMGEVYKAERADDQYESVVAIKLVRTDHDPEQVAWRFRSERQILATLEHRNIARLIDGGTTRDGVPYLVIELVQGEPIDRYCEDNLLGVNERIQLFLQVCAAVSFAHQRLVVHRDLKPSNILVTADGSVKLLDFGIAKLLEKSSLPNTSDKTATQWRVMTIEYASPEQVRGDTVTTVSDVYSLGVVLYRLLTGHSPYRSGADTVERVAEIMSDSAPTRPSVAVGADADRATAARDAPRSMGIRRVQKKLRGDLDNILLMALRKEPHRRYSSVDQLADDLRNYLEGQPVLARGDAWSYRAVKFVSRHRFAVAAGVLAMLSLIAGIVMTTWQARIAAEQSRIAQEEARKQRAVQSFMTALFDKNTRLQPDAAKARTMSVQELLVTAGDRVLREFSDTPVVHVEVMNTVARLLLDINEFDRASTLWQESVRIAREQQLTSSDGYVESLVGVATASRLLGRGEEALAARNQAIAELDARGDRDSLLRARALTTTVAQFAPDPAEEIRIMRDGVALFEARYPAEPAYFSAVYSLGHLLRTQGDMQAALTRFREATEVFERANSRDFTNLGASYAWAAFCEMQLGRIDEALRDYEKGIALLRQHAGDASIYTRIHLGLYADALQQSGQLAKAKVYFDEVLTPEAIAKPSSVEFDTAVYRANGLLQEGRPREALAALDLFKDSWLEFGKRFVLNGVQWLTARARAHAELGRFDAARQDLALVGELPAFYGVQAANLSDFLSGAIDVALKVGDLSMAKELLSRRESSTAPAGFDVSFVELSTSAAWLHLRLNDSRAALAEADAALAHLDQHVGNGYPFARASVLHVRGATLLSLGDDSAASADLRKAADLMKPLHAAQSPALVDVTRRLQHAQKRIPAGS